ncbi:MAG: serine hydrolase domain-containing protein, partial [Gammaproteobacteria bacterium]
MQTQISIDTPAGKIEGSFDPKFGAVYDAFVNNFLEHDEVGASCALTLDGQPMLDLWGGRTSRDGTQWTRGTISMVFSSTKGAMALCAHMLAERGQLDLDARVTQYWPEFGSGHKEAARVSMMLDHTAGVPHVREVVKPGGFWDYSYMVERVAAEPAFWIPGTRQGYHGITMAWTVGELIHRTAKQRLNQFFADEVAKPLGLDFWIGLPAAYEDRVAPMILAEPDTEWMNTKFIKTALTAPDTPTALFMRDFMQFEPNTRACRAAEVGSANGMANARALAGLYTPLANGGSANGVRLVGSETLTRMGRVSAATGEDAT